MSKHQKVQSCFSFFALKKKGFEESLHCRKVFVKNDFQGKKVRLHQWKKISVAFCKKDWTSDNKNVCVKKRLQEQKRQQKERSL